MTIKQIINTPHYLAPHSFDEEHKNEYSSIIIYEDDGKYGIKRSNGETVLPFEYDNISVFGFGIRLLIKKGKMGILHIKRDVNEPHKDFETAKFIPCEYDRIFAPYHDEIIIMEKDTMFGLDVFVYFTYVKKTVGPFCKYHLLSRDVVEVNDSEHRYLYDARTGEVFFVSDRQRFARSIFEVSGGTANKYNIHNYSKTDLIIFDAYDMEKDLSCFIYYNGEETFEYIFEGEPFIVYDFQNYKNCLIRQFAVINKDRITILDDRCEPIANFYDNRITLQSQLLCEGSLNGVNSQIICQTEFIAIEV